MSASGGGRADRHGGRKRSPAAKESVPLIHADDIGLPQEMRDSLCNPSGGMPTPPPAIWSPLPSPEPTGQRRHRRAARDAQAEASWQQRALNAEHALKAAQRDPRPATRISELPGQLRGTQHKHDGDTIENAALKQRIRDLAAQQRALDERLQVTRSIQPLPR
jgi:hypothetical protein